MGLCGPVWEFRKGFDMLKRTSVLVAFIAGGLVVGFVWGALAAYWGFERFIVRKDCETRSLYAAANACIFLKTLHSGDQDALSLLLENQLESGLLALANDDKRTLTADNVQLLSKIKGYMREHPIRNLSPKTRETVEGFLSTIPGSSKTESVR